MASAIARHSASWPRSLLRLRTSMPTAMRGGRPSSRIMLRTNAGSRPTGRLSAQ